MTSNSPKLIESGEWGEGVAWGLYEASRLPPEELCTAALCAAIIGNRVVLACSDRGWGVLGGHREDDEPLEETLRREAREEGGFVIDTYGLFAVCKVTAQQPTPHQQPGKDYPFPISYMAYYWATTKAGLQIPTGHEILESGSFDLDELPPLNALDQAAIEAGWQAYQIATGGAHED